MEDTIEIRKKIIEDEYASLNDTQREAVFYGGGPLLILAGAGSGKTTVIVNRISYLIKYGNAYNSTKIPSGGEEFLKKCLEDKSLRTGPEYRRYTAIDPIRPENLLAITFTNKAAGEMRDRLSDKFGIDPSSLWALTFHSFCVRLLRRYCDRIGYEKDFTIYDDHDSNKLIDTIIKRCRLNEKYQPKKVQHLISKAKINYQLPHEMSDECQEADLPKTPKIYEEYQEELKKSNAFDFDDLIFMTVKILTEYPAVRKEVNDRFKYILVDEYQDTNPLQYKLVTLLAGSGNICVVGDDDQSIYRFMGADVENILAFESQFKGTKTVRLEKNYRSTQTILDAANAVIANNVKRKGKNMWTENGDGEQIAYNQLSTQNEEGDFVAKQILADMEKGSKFNDFCVLYRTNAQSNIIEMALKGNGIPYRVFGGLPFFRRKEIQDILSYMNVINNHRDKTRLLRIINEPKRGIGATTVQRLEELSTENGQTIFKIIEDAKNIPDLQRSAEKLQKFREMIFELSEKAAEMTVYEMYCEILDRTGYETYLMTTCDRNEAMSRIENIRELGNNIKLFDEEADDASLSAYLEQTSLVSAIDNLDENEPAVTLMTMHCAKGLEFERVFITGFEEGLFPSQMSIYEDGGVEEERRLCYVSLTRARKKLYLSSVRQRMMYGSMHPAKPSRFLKEIPQDLIDELSKIKEDRPRPPKPRVISDRQLKTPVKSVPEKDNITALLYTAGQRVRHKVFGEGTIVGITKMSSDSLIEVNFDSIGTKKLMANFAKMEII